MKLKLITLGLALLLCNSGYVFAQDEKAAVKAEEQVTETEDASKFCPVCGPHEEMEELTLSYKHNGKKYSFCSLDCMKEFKKDPEKYLQVQPAEK